MDRFAARRAILTARVEGPILLMGNGVRARNLRLTHLPFRQDSNFLYYSGCALPGAALLLAEGKATLYAEPPDPDDALWHGPSPSLEERAAALGLDGARPIDRLEADCAALPRRPCTLAVPDLAATARAQAICGGPLVFGEQMGALPLQDAVVAQRRRLDAEEVQELRAAMAVTGQAHRAVMAATRPGVTEQALSALFGAIVAAHGLVQAYDTILTVDGHILHNFQHRGVADAGRLLLLDGGAESRQGYATDVTRTWPVGGRFDARQRAAYEAVLAAQAAGIEGARAGARYRELHLAAARVLASFLADEGLLRCAADDAVAEGAHALFFPHGLGHLVGLDVHDLESFGDRATYAGRPRSTQFGTAWLRIDLDLEPGMVVTVEPGFYVVPAILADPTLRARFARLVDFDRAAAWLGFGGIRVEDDVLVTDGPPEVLSADIPRAVSAIEALVGTAPLPFGAWLDPRPIAAQSRS